MCINNIGIWTRVSSISLAYLLGLASCTEWTRVSWLDAAVPLSQISSNDTSVNDCIDGHECRRHECHGTSVPYLRLDRLGAAILMEDKTCVMNCLNCGIFMPMFDSRPYTIESFIDNFFIRRSFRQWILKAEKDIMQRLLAEAKHTCVKG
jgi:hypothetical protein